jgi:signal transduction histidine kinase/CheY-like chemotaxis protein
MTAMPRQDASTAADGPPFADGSRGFVRLALGVAALLLAVGAFLAGTLEVSRQRVDAAAIDELQNLTLNLERYYFTRLQAADLVLQSATQEFATAGGGRDFTQVLMRLQQRLPEAPPMRATDEAGRVVYGEGIAPRAPFSVAERQFFKEALRSPALVVGLPLKSRVSSRWVLPIARQLRHADGGFAGVVYFTLELSDFVSTLDALKIGRQGVITIFNDHQEVIVRRPELPQMGDEQPRKLTATPLLAALGDGRDSAAYTTESSIDHVVRNSMVRRVGGYPAWVLVGLAEDEILAPWQAELRIALGFWLVLAAGGAALLVLQRKRERTQAAVLRQLEAARLQADAASRSKSMFLANMSHEIRTPLNGVLGFAQVGFIDPATPEPARQRFSRILQSGKLLQTLLDDVLDVSRIEAGKLLLEPLPSDVREVAQQVHDLLHGAAAAKGLALRLDVAAGVPAQVLVDPLRLQQVLINLASNAVKFTDAGHVDLRARAEGGELVFEVADTGMGMSANETARIFEPFEQADASVTRRHGGSGLGLTITRNLVALMGGSIALESRPGAGSTFTVRLPLVQSEASAPAAASPDAARGEAADGQALAGLRVLVVEDNPINRLVIDSLLRLEGAVPELAGDGLEAVARVEQAGAAPFDIALLDIEMPGIDGYETARRLQRVDPALPLLGQTARAMPEDRAQCLQAGMRDRVVKPIERAELVRLVRAHARRAAA